MASSNIFLRRLILDNEFEIVSVYLTTYVFITVHTLNTNVALSEVSEIVIQFRFASTIFVSTTAFLISSECCCLHCGCLAYMLVSPFPLEEFFAFCLIPIFCSKIFSLPQSFSRTPFTHACKHTILFFLIIILLWRSIFVNTIFCNNI